jgi:hypothetical protein
MDSEDYEEAVREYKRASELASSDAGKDQKIEDDLRKAETALKQSKVKDYYKESEINKECYKYKNT